MSLPRYPEYKSSGVDWLGSVPVHWETWKLRHAFGVIGSGTTPPSDESHWYDEGTIPWVTTGELRETAIYQTAKSVTPAAIQKFTTLKVHPKGALAIAMYGATIGRLGLLGVDAATNQACCVLSMPRSLDVRFVFYWLYGFKQKIIDLFATGGGQPNINQETISSLRIPAPNLPEQPAIASFLDRETGKIDALIAEQEKLLALLDEKRQATISHSVTKGLNPDAPIKDSGVAWLGEVPEHWELRQLKTVSTFTTSGPRGWSERISENGSLFIQSGDLNDAMGVEFAAAKRVTVENDAEAIRTQLSDGDVVVCITGAKTGNVAICNTVPEPSYVNQHLCLIRPGNMAHPRFLATQLKSRVGQVQFELSQYGLKQGLSLENVRETLVLLPPLREQTAIAAFLDAEITKLDALKTESERAIALLKERRSALIAAAVTGQIDVRGLVTELEAS